MNTAQTLMQLLRDFASEASDEDWLFFKRTDRWLSRGAVLQGAERVASLLAGLHVGQGNRVCLLLHNRREIVESLFGTMAAGGIAVPLNTAWLPNGIESAIRLCEPTVIICDTDHLHLLGSAAGSFNLVVVNLSPGTDTGTWRAIDYESQPAPAALPPAEISHRDPCLILFTSGTTGVSKGVVHNSAAMIHMARQAVLGMAYSASDVFYTCLPLFHANALAVSLIPSLLCRGRMVVAERFSAGSYWQDINQFGVTTTSMLGAMAPFLLERPASAAERSHRLRATMVVPTSPHVTELLGSRFGIRPIGAYGLTDVGHLFWVPVDADAPVGTCGMPTEGFECRLVDDNDEEVPAGQVGELVCRPLLPWIASSGYWGMPQATVEAWRNLWLHTGDLLRCDDAGWYYFVDRKKDAIRRRGENISSAEVEQAATRIEGILESAAFPVPSEWSEDEVAVAIVVDARFDLSMPELAERFGRLLPGYAVPRFVRIVERLPKTATEKVRKDSLRKEGVTPDTWDLEAARRQQQMAKV